MCGLTICHPIICPCQDPFCQQIRSGDLYATSGRLCHIIDCEDFFPTTTSSPCDYLKFKAHQSRGLLFEPGRRNSKLWKFAIRWCPLLLPRILGELRPAEEMCDLCNRKCVQPHPSSLERSASMLLEDLEPTSWVSLLESKPRSMSF